MNWPLPRPERKRVRDEAGAIAIMFILAVPLIIACLGVAYDYNRNVSTKTALQNALDTATVSGAAEVNINANNLKIDKPRATKTAKALYLSNRDDIAFLHCQKKAVDADVKRPPCWGSFKVTVAANGKSITVETTEKNSNAFLFYFGLKEQTYTLSSTAKITDIHS